MIKVIVGTNLKKTTKIVSSSATLRQVLEDHAQSERCQKSRKAGRIQHSPDHDQIDKHAEDKDQYDHDGQGQQRIQSDQCPDPESAVHTPEEEFAMGSTHMVLVNAKLPSKDVRRMQDHRQHPRQRTWPRQ